MRPLRPALLCLLVVLLVPAAVSTTYAAPRRILQRVKRVAPNSALTTIVARRWASDDALIARGNASRTWTWGPQIFRSGTEPYIEAPNGQRDTWYFDKARMEITQPDADPQAAWFITTGLLVRELISGNLQIGDTLIEQYQPANVPIAGDLDAPLDQTITYLDLQSLASLDNNHRVPSRIADNAIVTEVVGKSGTVAQDERMLQYDVYLRAYDEVLGHNLPDVFVQALSADQLLYIAGRPLTEPYWTTVPVNGAPTDVLLQAFERRVLTYTPSNPEGWQVEWGNVGRQYAQWRYGSVEAGPVLDPITALDPAPQIRPLAELSAAAVQQMNDRNGVVAAAVLDMNSGELFSNNGTRSMTMFSTVKVPIMLGVLDTVQREKRAISAWEDEAMRVMIQESSNDAASALLERIGGARALERYLRSLGLQNTAINRRMWGYSTTTVQDMTRLLSRLADCTILSEALCEYALDLMRGVEPEQAWGVSAGVDSGVAVALKNGWSPEDGWTINSIGYVVGNGKRYTIAIYSERNPSKPYGIETIEQASRTIYAALP